MPTALELDVPKEYKLQGSRLAIKIVYVADSY